MPRNVRITTGPEYVDVMCVDSGKSVKSLIVFKGDGKLVVELNQNLRITLQKHNKIANVFTGTHSGLTFECKFNK